MSNQEHLESARLAAVESDRVGWARGDRVVIGGRRMDGDRLRGKCGTVAKWSPDGRWCQVKVDGVHGLATVDPSQLSSASAPTI